MGFFDFFRRPKKGYYYGDYYEHSNYQHKQKDWNSSNRDKPYVRKDIMKSNLDTPTKPVETKKVEAEEIKKVPVVVDTKAGEVKKEDTASKTDLSAKADKDDVKPLFGSVFTPIYKAKKDVIVFAIDNTSEVAEHKNEILHLVNKIVQDNEKCFFMFLRMCNHKKYFDILNYETYKKEEILKALFVESEEEVKVDYSDALKHINDFLISSIVDFELDDKKYELQNVRIIFIGAGTNDYAEDAKKETLECIKKITRRDKVKALKYFCMEDNQTINIAALGFPVIGHIVTDFYA